MTGSKSSTSKPSDSLKQSTRIGLIPKNKTTMATMYTGQLVVTIHVQTVDCFVVKFRVQ